MAKDTGALDPKVNDILFKLNNFKQVLNYVISHSKLFSDNGISSVAIKKFIAACETFKSKIDSVSKSKNLIDKASDNNICKDQMDQYRCYVTNSPGTTNFLYACQNINDGLQISHPSQYSKKLINKTPAYMVETHTSNETDITEYIRNLIFVSAREAIESKIEDPTKSNEYVKDKLPQNNILKDHINEFKYYLQEVMATNNHSYCQNQDCSTGKTKPMTQVSQTFLNQMNQMNLIERRVPGHEEKFTVTGSKRNKRQVKPDQIDPLKFCRKHGTIATEGYYHRMNSIFNCTFNNNINQASHSFPYPKTKVKDKAIPEYMRKIIERKGNQMIDIPEYMRKIIDKHLVSKINPKPEQSQQHSSCCEHAGKKLSKQEKMDTSVKKDHKVTSARNDLDFGEICEQNNAATRSNQLEGYSSFETLENQIDETLYLSKIAQQEGLIPDSINKLIIMCEFILRELQAYRSEPQEKLDQHELLHMLGCNIDDIIANIDKYRDRDIITPSIEYFMTACEDIRDKIKCYRVQSRTRSVAEILGSGTCSICNKENQAPDTLYPILLPPCKACQFKDTPSFPILAPCKTCKPKVAPPCKKCQNKKDILPCGSCQSRVNAPSFNKPSICMSCESKTNMPTKVYALISKSCQNKIKTTESETNNDPILERGDERFTCPKSNALATCKTCQLKHNMLSSVSPSLCKTCKKKATMTTSVSSSFCKTYTINEPIYEEAIRQNITSNTIAAPCKTCQTKTLSTTSTRTCKTCQPKKELHASKMPILNPADEQRITCYHKPSPAPSCGSRKLYLKNSNQPFICKQCLDKSSALNQNSRQRNPLSRKDKTGYFEKSVKKITKINRYRDIDGTVKEEKTTVNIRRNLYDPSNTNITHDENLDHTVDIACESISQKSTNVLFVSPCIVEPKEGHRKTVGLIKSVLNLRISQTSTPILRNSLSQENCLTKTNEFEIHNFDLADTK